MRTRNKRCPIFMFILFTATEGEGISIFYCTFEYHCVQHVLLDLSTVYSNVSCIMINSFTRYRRHRFWFSFSIKFPGVLPETLWV